MLVLTFQVGGQRLALDVRRIREVVPCVAAQPLACSPPWLAGIVIYRGKAVPVLDLSGLLGAEKCPPHLSTRIILVQQRFNDQERLIGLLAAQVAEIRELQPPAQEQSQVASTDQVILGTVLVDEREIVHLLELDRLLPELLQRQLTLVLRELPA